MKTRVQAHKIVFSEAEEFFYQHAGYSHAMTEPAWSGRARSAVLLAQAEDALRRSDARVVWTIDPDADNEPGEGYFVSGHPQWQADLIRDNGTDGIEYLASLGSIDLGKPHDAVTYSEPYIRVIEAELAQQANL
jgi:hypothetical protein